MGCIQRFHLMLLSFLCSAFLEIDFIFIYGGFLLNLGYVICRNPLAGPDCRDFYVSCACRNGEFIGSGA